MNAVPGEPIKTVPDEKWSHSKLYRRVKLALPALPIHFNTETYIEGISAVDIFTLNATLGATIEDQVVNTLNQIRTIYGILTELIHCTVLCVKPKLFLMYCSEKQTQKKLSWELN